ncbi:rhomboid family intramembrane serine protease [Thermobispora bispora]|jgi:membrane associated rhomboid family serine protease|uniref:Rhomboid family protein n=1 Tax=Thermobispora bispora (strain ATCC 19993 / DSM 43833 / CBS 139.67 / JCM 10125 / KCTC 9307 / NBRC 14880 / R51) TaxID=469371 RepID=D6Y4X0_THEBD|nr:rhomboid family intramembrane serine protease [Thermobispora bispora]MBO2475183.1 rhomboid family intramembrane serine protease [Actinomycetales bacterium]MDI9581822.1 rhomboid family intramembrane serine protease [Thermobispora sp.]ADG87245.1 Rhomboid family protein [Thermobispora bispora DSM 43833]MBX6166149.1 rhomboid family intramembrane serine protease [Thermobispora bispora]QSI47198.1 rhomboid family intramembrane serine protease [Thermobispora bispora]
MGDYWPSVPPPPRNPGNRLAHGLGGALGGISLVVLLVAAMWVIEIVDTLLLGQLDQLGIIAQEPYGLPGILFAPFLHAGFGHLMANSVPLLILGSLAAIRGVGKFVTASFLITMVSGIGVWLTSPPNTLTLGASGLVFGYFGYVVARGLFDRRPLDIVLSVIVVLLYSSLLLGVLPVQPGVSWQGHLFGLIGGVLAAWLLRRRRYRPLYY